MLEIITYPSTKRIISHFKDDIYYMCVYTNKELTDARLKKIYPDYKFEERFAQLFGKKEDLESKIKNSINHIDAQFNESKQFFNDGEMLINGSIVRQISNRRFFQYENGQLQEEDPGYSNQGLFFKFIVSEKLDKPDIWIENPKLEIINRSHHLTSDSHIMPRNREPWEDDAYWM